ncbi:MAG: helix-turn-helix transcriptional regulator [Legionellaceae bacterium]|nr:helix-turn-helix transcriptional regulator [Legionellaceae bacterium]
MITETMNTLNKITGGRLTFGKMLKSIRLCDEINQGEFAKLLKVTQSYLSDLENNRKEISPKKAAEFARILGHSEKQFIRLAIQDSLERQGLHYAIDVSDAA